MQTKASVSIRIKEYLRYELLPLGVFVTAKHRHIENPPEDTLSAIILDVHTTATMPWPSYKECLGARSKLEEKFVEEKFESGWNLLEYLNAHHKWRWVVSRANLTSRRHHLTTICLSGDHFPSHSATMSFLPLDNLQSHISTPCYLARLTPT
jgi:hypothetical protein